MAIEGKDLLARWKAWPPRRPPRRKADGGDSGTFLWYSAWAWDSCQPGPPSAPLPLTTAVGTLRAPALINETWRKKMWEGWKCNEDSAGGKHYEVMVASHQEAEMPNVLLTATINMTGTVPLSWKVQILSFAPSAGEYVLFEDGFMTVEDAEARTWEKAQEILHGNPAQ